MAAAAKTTRKTLQATPVGKKKQRAALLLINRRSRSGAGQLDGVIDVLASSGYVVTVVRPRSAADGRRLLRDHGPSADIIVIGGGDGTMSGLLPVLLELGKPIGLLPLGTANDFARGIGLPRDMLAAAKVIADGRRRRVDVAFLDDRPFLNVAHLGFAVNVAKSHKGRTKKLLGAASYPLRWIAAYRRTRPIRVRITVDGREHETECVELAVGAGKYYGSGLCLSSSATLSDGLLRLHAIGPRSVAGWARLLPALVAGTVGEADGTLCLSGRKIRIEPDRRRAANVDGEIGGGFPATVTIKPRALMVFAPAPAQSRDRG